MKVPVKTHDSDECFTPRFPTITHMVLIFYALILMVLRVFIFLDEKIIVATTRLETMLGDTGIAVHPNDERYKVRIPLKISKLF